MNLLSHCRRLAASTRLRVWQWLRFSGGLKAPESESGSTVTYIWMLATVTFSGRQQPLRRRAEALLACLVSPAALANTALFISDRPQSFCNYLRTLTSSRRPEWSINESSRLLPPVGANHLHSICDASNASLELVEVRLHKALVACERRSRKVLVNIVIATCFRFIPVFSIQSSTTMQRQRCCDRRCTRQPKVGRSRSDATRRRGSCMSRLPGGVPQQV